MLYKANKNILTADYDGNVAAWDSESGEARMFSGKGHSSMVSGIATDNLDGVTTVGNDNKLRISSLRYIHCYSKTIGLGFEYSLHFLIVTIYDFSEGKLDDHDISLNDQPVGLALVGNSNPVVVTPTKLLAVHVS